MSRAEPVETGQLQIRALRARAVNVPMRRPLATSGGAVSTAPLVLIDLETEQGVTGHSYIFGYAPLTLEPLVRLLRSLGEMLVGEAVAPAVIEERMTKTFRLIGMQGLAAMAAAGIDMAAWDALAKAAGLSLARLLGGAPRPIRAYNSNGLGIIGAKAASEQARELVAEGFGAVKVRLGYPDTKTDVAVVRAVREAVGDAVLLMSDFNQSLSVTEAQQRIRHLDDEGLYWIEEPTRWDDYAGHALIRNKARTPVQIGENCWGPHDMAKALEAGACDYFMADAMKIGGVTGWVRAAAIAEPLGLPLSCHLFPQISAHLLSVTPTAHWLEFVDWADPILREPVAIEDGHAVIADEPGSGIAWNEEAVAKYLF
jgi:mandelate racemase